MVFLREEREEREEGKKGESQTEGLPLYGFDFQDFIEFKISSAADAVCWSLVFIL